MHTLECKRWLKYHNLLLTVTNQPSPLHFWIPHWWSPPNSVFSENAEIVSKNDIFCYCTCCTVKSWSQKKWSTEFLWKIDRDFTKIFLKCLLPFFCCSQWRRKGFETVVLFVFCYFAHCNPRGSAGLHFLDEPLRKTVPYLLFLKNLDEKILIYTS